MKKLEATDHGSSKIPRTKNQNHSVEFGSINVVFWLLPRPARLLHPCEDTVRVFQPDMTFPVTRNLAPSTNPKETIISFW